MSARLIYVMDPMCSWCWGFAPVASALIDQASQAGVPTHLVVGGLRSGSAALDGATRARLKARQGIANLVGQPVRVVDEAGADVPADGATLGEVVLRGGNVMLGYYRDEEATARASLEPATASTSTSSSRTPASAQRVRITSMRRSSGPSAPARVTGRSSVASTASVRSTWTW